MVFDGGFAEVSFPGAVMAEVVVEGCSRFRSSITTEGSCGAGLGCKEE